MKARFTGLYAWGQGWLSGRIAETWNDYFRNLDKIVKPSFWSYFERKNTFSTSQHLVGTSGSVFLHPMDLSYVGHSNLVSTRINDRGIEEEIFPEIDELKEILTGAANACGGIVEFSNISAVEMAEPSYVKGDGHGKC